MGATWSELRQSYDKGYREATAEMEKSLHSKLEKAYNDGFNACRHMYECELYPYKVVVADELKEGLYMPVIAKFTMLHNAQQYCNYMNLFKIGQTYKVEREDN